jgi:glycosyltransferase involved in cell wall biosynthesis
MRLLFCCEFYFPSVGGVQEVMRQLAERMVARGHEVVVATTSLADRTFSEFNGVQIVEFAVHGNNAHGIVGEVERYREFVVDFAGDAMMIKAAQQWTFDALWPVLDDIRMRKVFIPCGFSGLYEPSFREYFVELPTILRKFDHLVFYAESYRDIDFARAHAIEHFSVVPNGASEVEFGVEPDSSFRLTLGIGEDDFVFLTVGSMNGMKGHREIAEAFARMRAPGRKMTLILNGNVPPRPKIDMKLLARRPKVDRKPAARSIAQAVQYGVSRFSGLAYRSIGVFRREGYAGLLQRFAGLIQPWIPFRIKTVARPLEYWVKKANAQGPAKRIVMTDLARPQLVQAFMAADLFVFASNIEYSPLVLYETAAAGTPFLSAPVGNAEEIARWTCGGTIFPARKDERGYTWVDPSALAVELERSVSKRQELRRRGAAARVIWEGRFTWAKIAEQYEKILASGFK